MSRTGRPNLPIALLLSVSLIVSMFLLFLLCSLLIGAAFGRDRFTFGNEFFMQCFVFTAVVAEALYLCRAVGFPSRAAADVFSLAPARTLDILLAALAAVALTLPLSELDNRLQPLLPPSEGELRMFMAAFDPPGALERLFVLLSLVVAAPVGEELIFRGAVMSWVRDTSRAPVAVAVSALFFALSHVFIPRTVIPILVVGVFLGWLLVRTGSIFASIAAHAAFNGVPLVAYWNGLAVEGYNNVAQRGAHLPAPVAAGGAAVFVLLVLLLEARLRRTRGKG